MKYSKNWKVLFLFCLSFFTLASQENDAIEKLIKQLKESKTDQQKQRIYSDLSESYTYISPDTSYYYNAKSNEIAVRLHDTEYIAITLNQFGSIAYYKSDFNAALKYFLESIYWIKNINHPHKLASCFNNIGNIYMIQNNTTKALEYYREALKIDLKYTIKSQITNDYQNIGGIYIEMDQLDSGSYYINKSLKLAIENKLKPIISQSYCNLGNIAEKRKNYKEAVDFFFKSYTLSKIENDIYGVALNANNLAGCFIALSKNEEAKKYSYEVIDLAKKFSFTDELKDAYFNLSAIFSLTGNYKEAYNYHILYSAFKDSIFNVEKNEQLLEMNTKYDTEKKEQQNQLLQAKNDLSIITIKEQKIVSYFVICGLVIVCFVAFFIFNGLKKQRKANVIISKQKEEVHRQKEIIEEHQKETIDSINYAKRIQYALLAHEDVLQKNLPQHFVYFNPKDIVSGDFYWGTEHQNKFYLAVCDSTGHGVPGAFMSLLNIGFLSEAIKEKNIAKPNEVLNYVRQRLIESIGNDGQKDGMDAILLCFDKISHSITYSAANNAPMLIRDNEIIELSKDKMPVGKGERTDSFTLYTIDGLKGDVLYLYTDGYADQFGGPKGKKFKYKPLNELLLSICNDNTTNQKDILNSTFLSWKGSLEQVDDVCVVGIKL